MKSDIEGRADFSEIRYAQCWEDADILLEGLDIKEGDTVLSIASAGENTLSMLTKSPKKVYALDLSQAQIACLELRILAYKNMTYDEMLELLGVRESKRRMELYNTLKHKLSMTSADFFDSHIKKIEEGIISCGKFENYFRIFRTKILPIVHSRKVVKRLLADKSYEERAGFYDKAWNNLRFRIMFRLFFSRFVMGRLGRDKEFFKYVGVNVAENILKRTKYALVELNPAQNPYLQFILNGKYDKVLPHALRAENFEKIKENIDCIELRNQSVEEFLEEIGTEKIDAFNLSDIFEYMSESKMDEIYERIIHSSKQGARVVYWNMLARRECSEKFKDRVEYRQEISERLFLRDKAFFYSAFRVEQVGGKNGGNN